MSWHNIQWKLHDKVLPHEHFHWDKSFKFNAIRWTLVRCSVAMVGRSSVVSCKFRANCSDDLVCLKWHLLHFHQAPKMSVAICWFCTSTKLEKPMFYDPKTEQLGKHFTDKIAERYTLEEPTALRPQRSWWSEFWLQWINVRYTTSGSALRWHHWKWRKKLQLRLFVWLLELEMRFWSDLKGPERTWSDWKGTFDVNHGLSAGCWGRFCLTLRKHHRRAMAERIRLPQNDGFTNLICPVRRRAMPELAVQRVKGLICL